MPNKFYQPFDYETFRESRAPDEIRTPFQVDRDRVTFTEAFRRLQSKTQVFQSGEYDFYRTRLTHSIEVARIGRGICEYLRAANESLGSDFFIDSELVEALGLAHDIGHPPFGHIGERKLNELMGPYGGFEGNAQSLRIVADLIYERPDNPKGMSPTRAFMDGILKYKNLYRERISKDEQGNPVYPHNHFLYNQQEDCRAFVFGEAELPDDLLDSKNLNDFKSIECQILDWADDAAYSLHDILDGIKAGFIGVTQLKNWADGRPLTTGQSACLDDLSKLIHNNSIEAVFSNKIGEFIRACGLSEVENCMSSKTNRYRYQLNVKSAIREECELYKTVACDLIFLSPQIQKIEFRGGFFLQRLFDAYYENYIGNSRRKLKILPRNVSGWIDRESTEEGKMRRICDYLAGMTDGNAMRSYKRLYDPDFGTIADLQ